MGHEPCRTHPQEMVKKKQPISAANLSQTSVSEKSLHEDDRETATCSVNENKDQLKTKMQASVKLLPTITRESSKGMNVRLMNTATIPISFNLLQAWTGQVEFIRIESPHDT